MLVEERRQKIAEMISQRGYLSLPELASTIGVSESTVRRDLDVLHDTGLLRRTHGGAMASERTVLPAFDERTTRQVQEKRLIAELVAADIADGETVLLDGGTTTYEVARLLLGRTLQVVTNSLPIASLLSASREIDVVMLGGYVYPKTGVALGPMTTAALQGLRARRLIMSCGGLDQRGLFNGNLLLVETQRAMMRAADMVVLAVDHSKFGAAALVHLCDWGPVSQVVTDSSTTIEERAMVASTATVIVAQGPLQSKENGRTKSAGESRP